MKLPRGCRIDGDVRRVKMPLRGERVYYLQVSLPWPPLANNLHTVARGRKILSQDGRVYRDVVAFACAKLGHLEGRLCAHLEVWEPDRIHRDIINVEKAVTDGLVKCGTLQDDWQIDEWRISRKPVKPGGSVIITLWEIEPEPEESA
jgi:Holliday junction resolvase RusA-like endonuclease